ncbi:radical SAM protein [bacterium]|nr:radical SAM protein [bacterium]
MKREIISEHKVASCYFRSSVEPPYRKALLQITERCNLHCAHCFVSAGDYGDMISIRTIRNVVIPRLKECRVISVTLTGGEPFVHHEIIEIVRLLRDANIRVGICTNGTSISQSQIEALAKISNVHLNVSLDGFRPESHGKFRGDKTSFVKTIETIRRLSEYRLLQGLLVTPNNLAEIHEYVELCEFAIRNGATYVLMNPLSSMGRGVRAQKTLKAPDEVMRQIKEITSPFSDCIQVVYIRFPNDQKLPLIACEAGNIIYVFVHGELTVCPYLVFAAKTPQSLYKPQEFIVGNIFKDTDIADKLDAYKFHERYRLGDNPTCKNCSLSFQCGKGCPAAIIASGQQIEGLDPICSMINSSRDVKNGQN